jgi:ATP-dependent helicase/nuclease subunit B
MPEIRVHPTPYGRPAAEVLRTRVAAAKAGDPLAPVTVVVPTNFVGVSMRRWLASSGGIAGLTLLTVYRLAELLGAPRLAATGRRPVSTPVIAAAVRRVLAYDPGIFAPVREHPSTEEALVRAHRELSEVTADALDRLAGAPGDRGKDVVRIHRAVRGLLSDRWYEEADLMTAAQHALEAGAPLAADLGTVVVHLPQDLSLPAAGLLRAVADVVPTEVIAARTGAADADADLNRTLHRLGLDPPPVAAPSAVRVSTVVSVSDAEEEARSAVQRIVDALGEGVAMERMALLYPSPEPYARIVHEQLEAAEIPFNGRAVRPLSDRLAGRWLLDLLGLPDERYARPAVLGLITSGPVRGSEGRWVSSGLWERVSREAGIVHGRSEWATQLVRYATDARAAAEMVEAEGDRPTWMVERLRRNADQAEALHAFVAGLLGRLDAARACTTWRDLAAWCRDALHTYLGGPGPRERWPEVEASAAERVEAALDRLAGLDDVEPATDLQVFRRTLELELDDDLGRVGELGRGVLVGTPTAALGVDLDLVIVLGLAEGVFPTRPREDSLLPDAERERIADQLRPRAERIGVEHRHLLAALASASGQTVLSFPRGDLRRSVEHAPSRWLLEAVADLRGDGERKLPASAEWYDHVPSFAHRAGTVTFPATSQLYRLRALGEAGGDLRAHPLVVADPALRRGADLVLCRAAPAFTRFDGNLTAHAEHVASPTDEGRAVSASAIETWLGCPHAYLMEYVLRVRPVELPEELLEVSALERGSLVHDVLERWLRERLDEDVPAPGQPWPARAHERMRALAEEACAMIEARGLTGRPLLWRRDRRRILADLERFVGEDDKRRTELGATPVAAELAFGLDGDEPVPIELGDGRVLRTRGRIDRVDRTHDGTVVVADYKTGSDYSYRDLREDQPLGDGTRLQLGFYALAYQARHGASAVRSEYWFTSNRGEFKTKGYLVTDAVAEELRRALRVAVDGIEAGLFPMKPSAPAWRLYTECEFCDPDDLGTTDRYRAWERMRGAPELAGYVAYLGLDDGGEGS